MSLSVKNLQKVYNKPLSRTAPFEAVKDVSFNINPGEIYALLGPNGAGKSTIIKMIAGLVVPTSGTIILDNELLKNDSRPYKKLSAVLEGTRNIYWRLTPLENLHYFANLRGRSSYEVSERIQYLLELFQIEGKKKNQSQHLSRGMLQKLAFAAALVTDPQILLLDEPTLGLDVASSRKIKEIMLDLAKKQNKTILLTTHQMELAEEVADRVGIIRDGDLVKEGTISELRSVFDNYIYRFRIQGDFSIPVEAIKIFEIKMIHSGSDYTEFESDCKNSEGVYRLISVLQAEKREMIFAQKSIDDLEEIFLRVLS